MEQLYLRLNWASLWAAVPNIVRDPEHLKFINDFPDELKRIGAWSKRISECQETYFLLYTAPIIEIALLQKERPDATESPHWSSLMTAHMMLSLYLRMMDNVIDGDVHGAPMMSTVRLAEVFLTEAVSKLMNCGYSWTYQTQLLCNQWISYEESVIKGRNLVIDDLWERASTFLIIPQMYLQMRKSELHFYKKYLSLNMLVHDMHDVYNDIRAGRRTIPTEMLNLTGLPLSLKPDIVNPVMSNLKTIINKRRSELIDFTSINGLDYWNMILRFQAQEI